MGDNGETRQKEADLFLDCLLRRCDIIVFVKGSPWTRKAYQLMKLADRPDRRYRLLSKKLWSLLEDSKKCWHLEQNELQPLPEECRQVVNPDDEYLVRALITANADGIITTDERLREALSNCNIPVIMREDFLSQCQSP
jgi:hypothetical protein